MERIAPIFAVRDLEAAMQYLGEAPAEPERLTWPGLPHTGRFTDICGLFVQSN
jgi:hypothetical protein